MKRITGFVATLGIAASSAIGSANANGWPTRAITIVIPFAAGGAVEVYIYTLPRRLRRQLLWPHGRAACWRNPRHAGHHRKRWRCWRHDRGRSRRQGGTRRLSDPARNCRHERGKSNTLSESPLHGGD